jgi:hypothetical protein
MAGHQTEIAFARIEAALARIEAASQRAAAPVGELEARHEKLRAVVSQSLRQLDDLIAGQQP